MIMFSRGSVEVRVRARVRVEVRAEVRVRVRVSKGVGLAHQVPVQSMVAVASLVSVGDQRTGGVGV